MKKNGFQVLEPNGSFDFNGTGKDLYRNTKGPEHPYHDTLYWIEFIHAYAIYAYMGLLGKKGPCGPNQDYQSLPWVEDYWTVLGQAPDCMVIAKRVNIDEEFAALHDIAARYIGAEGIVSLEAFEAIPEAHRGGYLISKQMEDRDWFFIAREDSHFNSDRLVAQGLAYEALVAVDRMLETYLDSERSGLHKPLHTKSAAVMRIIMELRDQCGLVLRKESSSKGGTNSALVRKQSAIVPVPDVLRTERDALIADGRNPWNVASLLANRYGCTSDHIRKQLNKYD